MNHQGSLPQGFGTHDGALCETAVEAVHALIGLGFCAHEILLLRGNDRARTQLLYFGLMSHEHAEELLHEHDPEIARKTLCVLCSRLFEKFSLDWGVLSTICMGYTNLCVNEGDPEIPGHFMRLHVHFGMSAGLTPFLDIQQELRMLIPNYVVLREAISYGWHPGI